MYFGVSDTEIVPLGPLLWPELTIHLSEHVGGWWGVLFDCAAWYLSSKVRSLRSQFPLHGVFSFSGPCAYDAGGQESDTKET